MNRTSFALLSLLVSATLCGCGGKSVAAVDEPLPDGGAGGNDGSAGSGGSSGSGGSAGEAGSAGSAGSTGGQAGEAGAAGAGGSSCALVTGKTGCDDCMNDSCGDECNGCAANPDCGAFVTCALACSTGDTECMTACVDQNAAGVNDGLPLVGPDGCLRKSCNSECIVSGALCTVSMGDAACNDCVAGYCMAECSACAGNDACVSLVECALACAPDDTACTMGCAAADPGGIGDANAFAGDGGCVDKHCSVQCKGAPAQCGIELGDAPCDTCIAEQCLTPCNTCAANDSCVALVQCAAACAPDDQGCINTCGMQNPLGIADATAFLGDNGCVRQKCPSECGTGSGACALETGNAACDACIASECTGSCSACSANPDCVALVECTAACPADDIGCEMQCGADHTGGLQDAAPLIGPGGCVDSDCSFWCP